MPFAGVLHADPLLDVSGVGDLGYTINSDQAAAVTFTLTDFFTDLSVTADLFGINAQGGAFLMTDIGPTAGVGDIVDAIDLAGVTFAGSGTLLFAGLALGPGDYALIVASDQAFPTSTVLWNESTTPTTTTFPGIIDGIDFFASSTAAFPSASLFSVVFDRSAHFAVMGTRTDGTAPSS